MIFFNWRYWYFATIGKKEECGWAQLGMLTFPELKWAWNISELCFWGENILGVIKAMSNRVLMMQQSLILEEIIFQVILPMNLSTMCCAFCDTKQCKLMRTQMSSFNRNF